MGDKVSDDLRSLRVPSFCPICDRVMKGSKSNHSYYDFGCCYDCFIEFVEGREERWRGGWRPDEERLTSYITRTEGRT